MTDLGRWGLANAKLVYFIIAILALGGLYALYDMSKLEDPEIRVKQALVVVAYPGASAHEVELKVTDPLEKSIRTMDGVDDIESRSMNDLAMITVSLKTTVPQDEIEQRWDVLRRKVADAAATLPQGAGTPIVKDDFGDVFGMFFALTSDGIAESDMSKYAELIQRELLSIDGVSRVDLYGERPECINIDISEDRMANLGMHPAEILSALSGQNQTVYSGYYNSGDFRVRVAVNDKYKTVDEIGDLLIQGHQDDQFRLRDIATVSMGFADPVRNEMMYDNVQAIGISVAAASGTDITKVGKAVESRMEQIKASRLPAGVDYHKVFFQPERVTDALLTFMINLIEAGVIVVVILMFAMGFRSGVILAINIVVIVLGSLLILNMFGGALQRVSLAAFIIAMGLFVDNAIVIIDGILKDMQRKKPLTEALTAIGRQTAMPLLGATLIAILAFFPIFLSPDTAGIYVRDLFIVMAVSLLLSWVLALVYVPLQAKRYFKPKTGQDDKDPYDNKYYRALRRVLSWTMANRAVTIGCTLVLLIAAGLCYPLLPQGFFPDMNYNQLYIEYKLPEGYNSSRVKEDLEDISDYLLSRDEITHVTASAGGTPSRYNLVRSIADPSLSYGELIVDYTSSAALVRTMDEIQAHLTDNYPEAYVRLKRYNLMFKKFPIEVMFSGPDPAVLRDLTAQAQDLMRKSDRLTLVTSDWGQKTPVMMIDYNQPIARNVGITRQDVGLSILSAAGGIPAGVFYDGTQRRTILIHSVDEEGNPISSLDNAQVFSMVPSLSVLNRENLQSIMSGAMDVEEILVMALQTVPLSQVSNGVKIEWQDPLVIRYNGQRAMMAQSNPVTGTSVEDARQSIARQVESIELPEGYSMSWHGEHKASEESTKYLFRSFPLAVILMAFILILLFKDYKKPLIIICCIPLLLIGVVFGMLLSGKTFGFVAIVGVLGLIGMMIKNGLVLMDEIALQLSKGTEPHKALLDSSASRFRPVMIASITTVFGMIPLLSDDLFGPLAVTIMGGLFVGTLITLIFIPLLYATFFKIKTPKE